MVNLYSGTPGSGKSLHIAHNICNMLRNGYAVVCNFDIDQHAAVKRLHKNSDFLYVSNDEMTPNKLIAYSDNYFKNHRFKEGQINLIIDECQIVFNAREWNVKGRSDWLSFFTQHRKYGYDIYLIAQFDRMVDRQIRSLIEYEYKHRKIKNIGIGGWFFNLFAGGGLFISVKIWYPLQEKVGQEFFKYSKRYDKIYDSYKSFGTTSLIIGEVDPVVHTFKNDKLSFFPAVVNGYRIFFNAVKKGFNVICNFSKQR